MTKLSETATVRKPISVTGGGHGRPLDEGYHSFVSGGCFGKTAREIHTAAPPPPPHPRPPFFKGETGRSYVTSPIDKTGIKSRHTTVFIQFLIAFEKDRCLIVQKLRSAVLPFCVHRSVSTVTPRRRLEYVAKVSNMSKANAAHW